MVEEVELAGSAGARRRRSTDESDRQRPPQNLLPAATTGGSCARLSLSLSLVAVPLEVKYSHRW